VDRAQRSYPASADAADGANGSPGALVLDGSERVIGVVVLDIGCGEIEGIRSILNPDKLAHLGRTTNLGSLLRTRARRS
jgi:hypothetical protein